MKFNGTPQKPFVRPERDYYRRKHGLPCDGCNKTCRWEDGDYYMVYDRVWRDEARITRRRCVLCIACLEARLGRKLVVSDFTKYPVNCFVLLRFDENRILHTSARLLVDYIHGRRGCA